MQVLGNELNSITLLHHSVEITEIYSHTFLTKISWNQCLYSRSYQSTLWKFQDFSVFQILREINFWESRSTKSAILTHLEAPKLDFYLILDILKTKIYKINQIQSP